MIFNTSQAGRWLAGIVFAGGLGFAAPVAAKADTPTLNLFIWSSYISPTLISAFEKKCGCKVVETDYESNAELAAKLKAGGDAQYDVVVPSSYYVPELTSEGLLQKLDQAAIPNKKNLYAKFQNPPYDPGNTYSMPYQTGTTGLFYDPAKIPNPPQSWALIFDPKINPSYPFVIPKGEGRDQIAAACAYLGYGFGCMKKEQWVAAAKLIEQTKKRPNFAGFVDETPARDQVKSKLIAAGFGYNGDIGQCYADGTCKTIKYFLPKEGTEIWVDTMAIAAHAPHPQLANEFINFVLDADQGADLSNFNQYATPNEAAEPMLQDALKNTLIEPDAADQKLLQFLPALSGPDFKVFGQIWTSVLQ